jgi:hypothetical protein
MKNVTISLEEDVARWARVWAAKHDTSVSRMVGNLLEAEMSKDQEYERAKERFLERPARALRSSDQTLPSRDSLHERS